MTVMGDGSERYLGDGVYVRFDGYRLELWTERDIGVHRIVLEPEVYAELLLFVGEIKGNEADRG